MSHEEGQKIVIYWNLKKALAVICAVLLVPTVLVLLFSITLKTTLVNKDYYKNALVKADAYNRLINDGIPSLILDSQVSSNVLADDFAKKISIVLIQKFVDPGWVKDQTEGVIEKVADYFADPNKNIDFDLSKSQVFLAKVDSGLAVTEQMIPTCAQAQTNSTDTNKLLGMSIDCKNPATNLDQIKIDISSIRKTVRQTNLGVVNLSRYVDGANQFIDNVDKTASRINSYFWTSLILMIVFSVAIILLELKNLAFALKLLLFSLGVGSVLTVLAGVIWNASIPRTYLGASKIQLTEAIKDIANSIYAQFLDGIFYRLIWLAVMVVVISAIVYIAVVVLEKRKLKIFRAN